MSIDGKLVLEYLKVLVWPSFATVVVLRYGRDLIEAFGLRAVKLSFLGVELEAKEVERTLRETMGSALSASQWHTLEELERNGNLPRGSIQLENQGIRILRNAGVVKTIPEGVAIAAAKEIALTPLGKLLIDNRGLKTEKSS